jgi:hypothetical protein
LKLCGEQARLRGWPARRAGEPAGKVRGSKTVADLVFETASDCVFRCKRALVKRYIVERGSRETIALAVDSEMAATSIGSRAEVAAALVKAVSTAFSLTTLREMPNEGSLETGRTFCVCRPRNHWWSEPRGWPRSTACVSTTQSTRVGTDVAGIGGLEIVLATFDLPRR